MEILGKVIQKQAVIPANDYDEIRKYYSVAGPDYEVWSPDFNMHFGYCRSFRNLFSLKTMLENMNDEVISLLQIDPGERAHLADLGCGVGTVARFAAKRYPKARITGVTIVDYQVQKGSELIRKDGLQDRVKLLISNFEDLGVPDHTFSHAYAIESACHARGADKALFIEELSRTLKPGGRFCIADGFLKHSGRRPRLFNHLYRKILKCWALPSFATLEAFRHKLEAEGLTNIKVREISMRIAPSVAYVPWTCLKFFAREIWKNKSLRMKPERWNNVYGPLLGMLLGLYRKHFGYYIISGEKRNDR